MPAVVPIILGAAAYTGVSAAIGTTIAAAIGVSSIGAVAAAAIGTGVLSTGISLAQGQDLGDAIKSGVLSGATSFVGGTIGSYISSGSEAVASAVSEDAAFIAPTQAKLLTQSCIPCRWVHLACLLMQQHSLNMPIWALNPQ